MQFIHALHRVTLDETTTVLFHPALPASNEIGLATQHAALDALLARLLHVSLVAEPGPSGRPGRTLGHARAGTAAGPLRYLPNGWAQATLELPEIRRSPASTALSLPRLVPLRARLAQTAEAPQRLAVEWELDAAPHPLLPPDRHHGLVIAEDGHDFLTLPVATRTAPPADIVAEPSPPALGAALQPPDSATPVQERVVTISSLFVERPAHPWREPRESQRVPMLRIRAQWLARLGFDIGQRVRIQAEPGRLVLTPLPPTRHEPTGAA